jgi:hypothetical protein
MNRRRFELWATSILAVGLCACGGPRSEFSFTLHHASGDDERVASSGDTTGAIDDAAELAIDDDSWRLSMNLLGLDTSSQTITKGSGVVAILRKATGEMLTTDSGGSCTVTLEPHQSSNGSIVNGAFYCSDLGSPVASATVDVVGGIFQTKIDDAANDPGPGH